MRRVTVSALAVSAAAGWLVAWTRADELRILYRQIAGLLDERRRMSAVIRDYDRRAHAAGWGCPLP